MIGFISCNATCNFFLSSLVVGPFFSGVFLTVGLFGEVIFFGYFHLNYIIFVAFCHFIMLY